MTMTREIKFRAWVHDKDSFQDRGWYMTNDNLIIRPGCWVSNFCHGNGHGKTHDLKGFYQGEAVLMQYTGLKDTNGTEIYEGDIVKITGFKEKLGSVKYHISKFIVEFRSSYTGDLLGPFLEVIGNIYENPELLRAKNES